MSLSKFIIIIFLFLFFLPICYFVANIFWFNFVDGKLFVETDRISPFTNFLPPYIHNCCGDFYAQGWNEEKVATIGKLYIFGIIFSSVSASILLVNPVQKFFNSEKRY